MKTLLKDLKGLFHCYKYFFPFKDMAKLIPLSVNGPRSNLTTSKDSQPMISYRLVSHYKPLGPIISLFIILFNNKFGYPCLTLKEASKVKSDHTRRFAAHDFL